MDGPNREAGNRPLGRPSPPHYNDYDSPDEYASDDDPLSDHDIHLLNTDYALQRDLTFHPATLPPYQPDNRSIPPGLRHDRNSVHETYDFSEEKHWTETDGMYDGGHSYQLPFHNAHAYQNNRQRRPLVDLIRNEWQHNTYSPSSSPTFPSYTTPNWLQIISAPRFRRCVYMILVLLSVFWGIWYFWAGPKWTENSLLVDSLSERIRTGEGWFGENLRPGFLDMIQVKKLDQNLVPQQGDRKRLIVVGDVHGCHEELLHLLTEAQYEARSDHLILVGDFIAKGPSSSSVVDLAMSAHASCVRGNHEDRALLAYRDMYAHRLTEEQGGKPSPPKPGMPKDMAQDEPEDSEDIEQKSFAGGDTVDRKLAGSFTERQIDYMAGCPVILDLGRIRGLGDVHVVHAGLIAGVRPEKQDPMGVMHMRTIDLKTHVPSSGSKGVPWYKLWNKYQTMIPLHHRSTVIYGHDSYRGLHIEKYSKGIDTGCVRGGRLTAVIVEHQADATEVVEPRLVSVPCKDYRQFKEEATYEGGNRAEG